ncbi:MAG: hypothetical protein ACFNVT_11380 [Corynebacterium matruchotii]|uniref:hypothetical protein n=1 Tax=Corynebacterium matruchotii TaxID=43768 RepID=UPI003606FA5B
MARPARQPGEAAGDGSQPPAAIPQAGYGERGSLAPGELRPKRRHVRRPEACLHTNTSAHASSRRPNFRRSGSPTVA